MIARRKPPRPVGPYVRVIVWADRKTVEAIKEAPLSEAFRADGHTLAGDLGKLYREYVTNPDYYVSIQHHLKY